MKNENQTDVRAIYSKITVKNVIRILSVLCFIFCFCPSFLVSCGGQDIDINVMTAVQGVSMNESQIAEPQPVMILCYLTPILILAFLAVRTWADSRAASLIFAFTVVDAVFWIIFRSTTKQLAEQCYCSFRTTAWFVFNMVSLSTIIILSVLVLLRKVQLDTSLDSKDTREVLIIEKPANAAQVQYDNHEDITRRE